MFLILRISISKQNKNRFEIYTNINLNSYKTLIFKNLFQTEIVLLFCGVLLVNTAYKQYNWPDKMITNISNPKISLISINIIYKDAIGPAKNIFFF